MLKKIDEIETSSSYQRKSCPNHKLVEAIEFARKYLPSQGPLEYFVHHNTLHSLEEFSFFEALNIAEVFYGAKTKKSLRWYQKQYFNGRIKDNDLINVIQNNVNIGEFGYNEVKELLFWNRDYRKHLNTISFNRFKNEITLKKDLIPAQFRRVSTFRNYSRNHSEVLSVDKEINDVLLRFFAAYFDKGVAYWQMEDRNNGLLTSFQDYCTFFPPFGFLKQLKNIIKKHHGVSVQNILSDCLSTLCPIEKYWNMYLFQTLYKVKGWSALAISLESNDNYNPTKINSNFEEFSAIIMSCELTALSGLLKKNVINDFEVRPIEKTSDFNLKNYFLSYAYELFEFDSKSEVEKNKIISLLRQLNESVLFKIWHEAYENNLIQKTISVIDRGENKRESCPEFQIVTCIDDREESTRRYFEEVSDKIETFGYAGHFGLNILFKGLQNAHFRPLCPVSVVPEHYVWEESKEELKSTRILGKIKQFFFHYSKLPISTAVLTVLTSPFSLLMFILSIFFPLLAHKLESANKLIGESSLNFMNSNNRKHKGYTDEELAQVVYSLLKTIGLEEKFAPCIFICAHGSESMNNPHEAAHDCGACGGGRGAPNARLFAQAANNEGIRNKVKQLGIKIPKSTVFIGGYHNTCSDDILIFDKDKIEPELYKKLKKITLKVEQLDATERVRKFEDVSLESTPSKAFTHVQARSFNYSQPRPEYGHATNAICVVGNREITKNVFFDRRAFLVSYNSKVDEGLSVLKALVSSIVPVCAGINLEYYFSYVDREVFGSGVKQPHNVTSLMGVMNGHKSDLRLGLPWQMVEIHEPVRIIIIIETTVKNFENSLNASPGSKRLVENEWVRIILFTPENEFYLYRPSGFTRLDREKKTERFEDSVSVFKGKRDLIDFKIMEGE